MSKRKPKADPNALEKFLPVELFKALGDPTRIRLLVGLTGGTQTVSEVAEACPLDISVVSRHLRILARAGVLASSKQGKHVRYRVRVEHIVGMLRGLADAMETCCVAAPPTISGEGKGRAS